MKTILLGTGAPLIDPYRKGASLVVLVDDEPLLFDCGYGATLRLVESGINPMRINHLFITHRHYDHTCDFPYLMLSLWTAGRRNPLTKVYGPTGTQELVKSFLDHPSTLIRSDKTEMEIAVKETNGGSVEGGDGWNVTSAVVDHIPGEVCLAYRIESQGKSVVFSGDTAYCDSMVDIARGADLLVQECTFPDEEIVKRRELGMFWRHTGPNDVARIAREAGVQRIVLTHLGPYASSSVAREVSSLHVPQDQGEEVLERMLQEVKANFQGEVTLGKDLMTLTVP